MTQHGVEPPAAKGPILDKARGGGAREPSSRADGVGRDPADDVEIVFEDGGRNPGPIEAFLRRGGKIPVLLLTCNRADLLRDTIEVRARDAASS